MVGQSALWQVVDAASDGTETNVGNPPSLVLFNEAPVVTAGGRIFTSEFNVRNSIAENPKVNGNANEIQDMGLDGIDVQITGTFRDVDATNTSISKIMSWIKEGKTTTNYNEGRFGLRIDDFPYFNMVPTKTTSIYGYALQNIQFVRTGEPAQHAGFILTLRAGGDIDGWFTANGF